MESFDHLPCYKGEFLFAGSASWRSRVGKRGFKKMDGMVNIIRITDAGVITSYQ